MGGGDSFLPDFLLAEGFNNISVLDISEEAIKRARQRLGEKADSIQWIVADASRFTPEEKYGIEIRQYAADDLVDLFSPEFYRLSCENVGHKTPSGSIQDFSFCRFQRR